MQMEVDLEGGSVGYASELADAPFTDDDELPECDEDGCDEQADYEVMYHSTVVKARIVYLCEEHKDELIDDNE